MQNPEFNFERTHAIRREMGKSTKLTQDGNLFDVNHKYLGVDELYQPPKEPEVTPDAAPDLQGEGREGVLRRAAAKLDGYSTPEELSETSQENRRAQQAERLAG
jgi:hypothetical protein